jgi:tetratricopeptide (TPR) repeat protein
VLQEVRDPDDPDHCLARVHAAEAREPGLAYQHAGDDTRAEAQFTRALSKSDIPRPALPAARIYERSGRTDEAIADLERALAEHPHGVEACPAGRLPGPEVRSRSLGRRTRRGAGARPRSARVGDARRGAQWTGEQWRRLPRPAPGEPAAATGRDGSPPPLVEALARQHAGDLEGAIQSLTRGSRSSPAAPTCAAGSRGCCSRPGDSTASASTCASRSAELALPRSPDARGTHGGSGDAAAAEEQMVAALVDHEQYPDLWFGLGPRASAAATWRARSSRSNARSS